MRLVRSGAAEHLATGDPGPPAMVGSVDLTRRGLGSRSSVMTRRAVARSGRAVPLEDHDRHVRVFDARMACGAVCRVSATVASFSGGRWGREQPFRAGRRRDALLSQEWAMVLPGEGAAERR